MATHYMKKANKSSLSCFANMKKAPVSIGSLSMLPWETFQN